eukprot:m51a1_g11594 hypothetical protein (972) ;mRNA; f:98008-101798
MAAVARHKKNAMVAEWLRSQVSAAPPPPPPPPARRHCATSSDAAAAAAPSSPPPAQRKSDWTQALSAEELRSLGFAGIGDAEWRALLAGKLSPAESAGLAKALQDTLGVAAVAAVLKHVTGADPTARGMRHQAEELVRRRAAWAPQLAARRAELREGREGAEGDGGRAEGPDVAYVRARTRDRFPHRQWFDRVTTENARVVRDRFKLPAAQAAPGPQPARNAKLDAWYIVWRSRKVWREALALQTSSLGAAKKSVPVSREALLRSLLAPEGVQHSDDAPRRFFREYLRGIATLSEGACVDDGGGSDADDEAAGDDAEAMSQPGALDLLDLETSGLLQRLSDCTGARKFGQTLQSSAAAARPLSDGDPFVLPIRRSEDRRSYAVVVWSNVEWHVTRALRDAPVHCGVDRSLYDKLDIIETSEDLWLVPKKWSKSTALRRHFELRRLSDLPRSLRSALHFKRHWTLAQYLKHLPAARAAPAAADWDRERRPRAARGRPAEALGAQQQQQQPCQCTAALLGLAQELKEFRAEMRNAVQSLRQDMLEAIRSEARAAVAESRVAAPAADRQPAQQPAEAAVVERATPATPAKAPEPIELVVTPAAEPLREQQEQQEQQQRQRQRPATSGARAAGEGSWTPLTVKHVRQLSADPLNETWSHNARPAMAECDWAPRTQGRSQHQSALSGGGEPRMSALQIARLWPPAPAAAHVASRSGLTTSLRESEDQCATEDTGTEATVEVRGAGLTQEERAAARVLLEQAREAPDRVWPSGIDGRTLALLSAGRRPNRELVERYMDLVSARCGTAQATYPRCYVLPSSWYDSIFEEKRPGVLSYAYKNVCDATNGVDLLGWYDKVLVPIPLGEHWCLAVANVAEKRLEYFDSRGGTNDRCLTTVRRFLRDEAKAHGKPDPLVETWKVWCPRAGVEIPAQFVDADSGVFCCAFADCVSRDAEMDFTQASVPELRLAMALELSIGHQ